MLNKTQIWYCDLPLFTWWERPSAHLRTRVTRCKGCTRKLLYHFGSAQVNVEFLMARTSKIWQVSSFQSLLPSPQLQLKPTLPLQRTLLCIVHYHEFTFNWWVMQLEVPNCGMRKPIHRMGFPPLQHQISHAFCLGGRHMTKAIDCKNLQWSTLLSY